MKCPHCQRDLVDGLCPECSRRSLSSIKTGKLFRVHQVRREDVDQEARTVALSFSSETPVRRFFGVEILDHQKKSVKLDRLRAGGPFLMDHNPGDQRGVIEDVSIDTDRKGRAVVRFGKSTRADELFQDMADGIRKNISVGYLLHKVRLEKDADGVKTYRATDWEPLEISSVSIPADTTVGVGRSDEAPDIRSHETIIEEVQTRSQEEEEMTCKHCQRALQDGELCSCDGARRERGEQISPPSPPATATVDESGIRQQERQRIGDINAIARQFGQRVSGLDDLARQFVDNGQGVDAFRAAVMQRMGQPEPTTPPERPDIDLNEREDQEYSITRAIRCAAFGDDAGFERELSDEIGKKLGRRTGGIFVPTSLSVRAPATAGTAGTGAETVQTTVMPIIELLRNRMMIKRLGAQVLPGLQGDLQFPRQEKAASLNWAGENPGADTADTDMTSFFGQVDMSPKNAIATMPYTRQLLYQSVEAIEQFLRNDLTTQNAIGLDLAAINGAGGNQPTGILNTSGIGVVSIGTDGGAPTWDHIVGLESEVAIDNADVGSLGYLTNAKARGKLKTVEKATGTAKFLWEDGREAGFGSVNGYRGAVSNQVPSDLTKGVGTGLSAMLFGNFGDIIIGEWGVIELLVDELTLKKQGIIELTSYMLVDLAIRHPQSFAAIKDMDTV